MKMSRTLAEILEVSPDAFSIVDQGPLGVQIGRGSIWKGPVIQVEQMAVVGRALRCATVKEGPAEELVLDFACQSAGGLALNLQLLVGVIMQAGVLCHLVVRNADPGHLEDPLGFAGLLTCAEAIDRPINSHILNNGLSDKPVGIFATDSSVRYFCSWRNFIQ